MVDKRDTVYGEVEIFYEEYSNQSVNLKRLRKTNTTIRTSIADALVGKVASDIDILGYRVTPVQK